MPFTPDQLDKLAEIDSAETRALLSEIMAQMDAQPPADLTAVLVRLDAIEAQNEAARMAAIAGFEALKAQADAGLAALGEV